MFDLKEGLINCTLLESEFLIYSLRKGAVIIGFMTTPLASWFCVGTDVHTITVAKSVRQFLTILSHNQMVLEHKILEVSAGKPRIYTGTID